MNNLRGVLYAVVSSATFGLIPLFSIPLLQGGMSSPAILFYRFGLAAAMMGLIALATRRPLRITWPQTGTLLLLGAMYSVTALGLLRSYTYIPSSVATTINFLYPLGVAIVMTLFFREKNSVWLLVAILISLVGVALLSWGDIGGPQSDRAIVGVGFAGATVLTYTIYIVGVKKSRISRLDPMIQAFYVLLFSACFFLVYALSTTGAPLPGKWHLWQNLLLLALVPTVVSNLTLVLAIKEIGSTMTSILGSMEPLTAVLVGVLHFGEKFGLDSASGLILIITAVIIVLLPHRPRKKNIRKPSRTKASISFGSNGCGGNLPTRSDGLPLLFFRPLGKPPFFDPLALFEQFADTPERRGAPDCQQGGPDDVFDQYGTDDRRDSHQEENPPDPHSEIVFAFSHQRMKNTDDEKRGDTDHDAGQMIFHQKFHSSTLLCFSEQNTCPVGKTDTEHAAGNVPSMSSSFAAKIRLSRGQKQIYLYFAEAEYLRRSQRYE